MSSQPPTPMGPPYGQYPYPPPQQTYPPPQAYPSQPFPPQPFPPQPYPPQQAYPPPQPPRTSSNSPVVIVLVLILLAIAGFGAYYFLNQQRQTLTGAPVSIAGTWDLVLQNCTSCTSGNAENDTMSIQQTGDHVTAAITSINGGGGLSLAGTVSGQNLVLDGSVSTYGANCTIHFTGTITDSDHMSGALTDQCTGGGTTVNGRAEWTATRKTT